jgi:hypothetical protein
MGNRKFSTANGSTQQEVLNINWQLRTLFLVLKGAPKVRRVRYAAVLSWARVVPIADPKRGIQRSVPRGRRRDLSCG